MSSFPGQGSPKITDWSLYLSGLQIVSLLSPWCVWLCRCPNQMEETVSYKNSWKNTFMWQWSISEGPLFSPCFDLYKKLLLSAFNEIEIKPKKPLEEIPPSSLFIHFVSPLLYRKSTNNNVVTSRDDTLYSVSSRW